MAAGAAPRTAVDAVASCYDPTMDILWRAAGRRPRLERWESRPLWPGVEQPPSASARVDAYEREAPREGPGAPEPAGPHRRVATAILRYRIFPPALVSGVLRREPVQVGDTVGICYHAPLGIGLFFAAKVVACFDGPEGDRWRTGFTYRMLRGHPELGEETFAVEKDMVTGRVWFSLRSWSRPGTLLARLFSPVVRVLQVHASRAALDHLEVTSAEVGDALL